MIKFIVKCSVMFLMFIILLAGCSKVPTVEIDAATTAVGVLVEAGAAEYAATEFSASQSALALLNAEIDVQHEKNALLRNFKDAKVLALSAKKIADEALVTTEANKTAAKLASTAAINDAKTALFEAKRLITIAPVGKGSKFDVAMLQADVASIEQMLIDVDSVFVAGKYNEALTRATAASNSANAISADINAAIAAKLK